MIEFLTTLWGNLFSFGSGVGTSVGNFLYSIFPFFG